MRQDLPPAKGQGGDIRVSAGRESATLASLLMLREASPEEGECVHPFLHLPLQCPRRPELLQAQSPGQDHPCQLEPVSLLLVNSCHQLAFISIGGCLLGRAKEVHFECRDESPDHSTGRVSVRSFGPPKIRCLATPIPDSFRPSLRNLLSVSRPKSFGSLQAFSPPTHID